METVGPSRSTSLSQHDFYDIYLLSASNKTSYFLKMRNLIQRNGWKMTSPFESKLGVPVLKSIEENVSNCSHVVYLITKEDGENEDINHTMTIEMAFQSLTDKGLGGRVIPVFCCDTSFVSPKLRSLTGESIHNEALEERLKKSIDVNIRKKREEEYRSVLEPLQGASSLQPQQTSHQSTEETLDTVSEVEFLKLAQAIHPSYYEAVGISLGIPHAQLQAILSEKLKNYKDAFMDVFMKWNVKQQPPHSNKRQLLGDKLREIDLGGLSDRILNEPLIHQ